MPREYHLTIFTDPADENGVRNLFYADWATTAAEHEIAKELAELVRVRHPQDSSRGPK